jgi:hypothetical protein
MSGVDLRCPVQNSGGDNVSLDEYQARKRALRESEGARLQSDLLALERSLRVFLGNCDELFRLTTFGRDPEGQLAAIRLWALNNREGFDRFLDEVERLLHNVFAAAMSLRDHSIRVRKKWLRPDPSDTLAEQYDEWVRQTFGESRAAQLVAGLRNIVQHRKLPRLLGGIAGAPGQPVETSVRFETDDLLEWDGWGAEIRTFLQQSGDSVELDEILSEYREAAIGFHDWFVVAVRERNASALQELARGRRELSEYGSTLFGRPLNDPESDSE